MKVSKSGLLKIISVLTIIDLIAGFWYISLRIENSEGSSDLWEKTDSVVENADTITELTRPDTFNIIKKHSYFISNTTMMSGNDTKHAKPLISIIGVKVRLPLSINGNDSISHLECELAHKAFGNMYETIKDGMNNTLNQPMFTHGTVETIPYKKIDKLPNSDAFHYTTHITLIYPLFTSHRLLVMEIDHKYIDEKKEQKSSHYVHYDRINQNLITRNDILIISETNKVLSLINQKIDTLNEKKGKHLKRASKVPQEVCAMKKSLAFFFAPGEIDNEAEGEIEIHVPYTELESVLTNHFLNVLETSTGWWQFKPLQ